MGHAPTVGGDWQAYKTKGRKDYARKGDKPLPYSADSLFIVPPAKKSFF